MKKSKPAFEVFDKSLSVTLPTISLAYSITTD